MDLYLCNNKDFSGIWDRFSLDSWETVTHTIKRQITGCLALFDIDAKKNRGRGEGVEDGCGMDSRANIIMIYQFLLHLVCSFNKHFVIIEVYTHIPIFYSPVSTPCGGSQTHKESINV